MIPVFDDDRSTDAEYAGERHIDHEQMVTMRVDATDQWINVPVRTVLDDQGWHFEIGPYSVVGSDATKLINELAHYGRQSGEFKAVER
ncbi:hypothetical protein [Tsukamurella paurometabola]|uniref:Uncharacterized protein n=1 Tax=Tsukamurella paurometabola TaxID=2061 RepID=A0A3P8KZ92_TSUPA|nr:hypothetical protein [Tsukamurella paurometabola]UEA84450.1 hypothetical protein LK411_06400 [Tsukamurella paurometabola]VDR37015.1 Uncharacterised protein [Tsukamurella paurometabola]